MSSNIVFKDVWSVRRVAILIKTFQIQNQLEMASVMIYIILYINLFLIIVTIMYIFYHYLSGIHFLLPTRIPNNFNDISLSTRGVTRARIQSEDESIYLISNV